MAFERSAYNPPDGLNNALEFPSSPGSEAAFRAQFQEMFDQARDLVGKLMAALESVETGKSGAENIGSAAIEDVYSSPGVLATTVRSQIEAVKAIAKMAQEGTLIPGSINNQDMFGAGVVTLAAMAENSVDSDQYVDGSIDTEHISSDAVTQAKIADDAVGASQLADNAVFTAAIQNLAVTESKIATNAVTETKIGANAVTAAKILNSTISEAKLDSALVAKLAADRTRKIIISTANPSGGSDGDIWLKYS